MNLISALKKIQEIGAAVMRTDDVALKLGVSNPHASQILRRLAAGKYVIRLMKGLWLIDLDLDPLALPGYLTAPFPCYVSLQTALYHHGLIDQIPRTITVVSLCRTRMIKTAVANISIHHIGPEFFFDYEMDYKTQVMMATPEKALLDFLYLKPAKSLWFKSLPEVEIDSSFNIKKAFEMIKKIPSKSRRTIVEKSLRVLLKESK